MKVRTDIYRWMRRGVVMMTGLLLPLLIAAQQVQVKAEATPDRIRIGEQFHLKVTATHDDKTSVSWPGIETLLGDKFEVIKQGALDTSFEDGKKKIIFSQDFTLTSFDTGRQVIPSFEFLYQSGNDTLHAFTDSLRISVSSVEVDTTKGFYDIAGPIDAPFSWKEILPYIIVIGGAVVVGVAVFFLVFYLIARRKHRLKAQVKTPPPPPAVPAHILALERLEALRQKKLWQGGSVKEYYSELTDILREYIHNRYSIDASEMTTEETMRAMRLTDAGQEAHNKLGQVLRLADLVKFAKAQPLSSEHEMVMDAGEDFVRLTLWEAPPAADSTEKP